jgi:FlgD Ig-like domain
MISSLRNATLLLGIAWLLVMTGPAFASTDIGPVPAATIADTLANDSWVDGQATPFQGGFVAGEMAAVRLDPNQAGPYPLDNVHFLMGGATTSEQIRLHIWQDNGGGSVPGTQIYFADFLLVGSDVSWQEIDLSAEKIIIDGTFWVGVEFTHSGLPSVCRDNDGINTGRNFIYASDSNWYDSALFGLAGDWVIRAVQDVAPTGFTVGGTVSGLNGSLVLQNNGGDNLTLTTNGSFTFPTPLANGSPYAVTVLTQPAGQNCTVSNGSGVINGASITNVAAVCTGTGTSTTLQNDSWAEGQNANFQSGFLGGEMAASRFVPPVSGAQPLNNVHFLFGGDTSLQTVTLHIWQDAGGTEIPGTEIFTADYLLAGSNDVWQELDLSAEGIQIDGTFRVGIEFQHAGLPSVARDNDGITADRNFIFTSTAQWFESSLLGLTGDWIIRASVGTGVVPGAAPVISSITDVPNDQGRQVRLIWSRASYDAPGSPQPISEYAVFRRQDAFKQSADQSRLTGWDFISTVPAFGEDNYQYLAPTLCDSTVDEGVCWSVFMVRAMTASPYDFFDSDPDSGYSLDNLAPNVPDGFVVSYGTENSLSWKPSDDADFRYFKIYRGDEPDFVIDPMQPVATVTEAVWLDQTGDFGSYYRISSVDFAGNESQAVAPGNTSSSGDLPLGKTALLGNVPNPFNPLTTISFVLDHQSSPHLAIFDVSGRLVRNLLVGETHEAGRYDLQWNGKNAQGQTVAAGVYFYHLKVDGFQQTRRMTLIK